MSQHTVLLEGPPPAVDSIPSRTFAPVLIQVPRLTQSSSRPSTRRQPVRRGRRRLRREVRVAIAAMAFAIPMSWAMLSFGKVSPDREKFAPIALAVPNTVEGAPLATLSLDTIGTLPSNEMQAPVVLPAGYLVPDDGAEDANHAGN